MVAGDKAAETAAPHAAARYNLDGMSGMLDLSRDEKAQVVRLCHALDPFPEERVDEAVFLGIVEYEAVGYKPVDRALGRRSVEDGRGGKKLHREYFPPALDRKRRKDAHLKRRESADEDFVVIPLAGKDDFKPSADVFLRNGLAMTRAVPYCIAKLLHVAWGVPGDVFDGFERGFWELALAGRESGRKKLVEVAVVDFADRERRGTPVEGAVRVHEDVRHPVADAAEEDVGRLGVELNASAHDGDDPLPVLYVEDVLELVEDYAAFAFRRLRENCIKDGFKRGEVCGCSDIHGDGRRARVRVNGKSRPQTCKRMEHLFEKSGGVFEPCKCGREPTAEVGGVANAEQVRVEYRDSFHAANGLQHERRLSHAPFALHHDILAGFHVAPEDAGEFWSAAEVLAVNGASVFERIHDFLRLAVLHYAVQHYAILHNACIIPNRADGNKGANSAVRDSRSAVCRNVAMMPRFAMPRK